MAPGKSLGPSSFRSHQVSCCPGALLATGMLPCRGWNRGRPFARVSSAEQPTVRNPIVGHDIHSNVSLTITRVATAAPALAAAVGELGDIPELAGSFDATGEPIEAAAAAVAAACDISTELNDLDINFTDSGYEIAISGWGRHRSLKEALEVLAGAGFVGTVECEEESYERWRYRIAADGVVHTDSGFSAYTGGPIAGVWIVQMQCPDDSDLDHVAVVGAEADAPAILAGWAREDARRLIKDGVIKPHRIDLDAETDELLDQWASASAAKWDVYPAR